MLDDVQRRRKEMLRLEQSLIDLQNLYLEMSYLIESQGEMLEDILGNVENADAYTRRRFYKRI